MSVKPHDEERIRKAMRASVLDMLENDVDGRAENFKEAWEECGSVDEQKIANDEIRQIIALVKGRG